jgi:hypothetical protein
LNLHAFTELVPTRIDDGRRNSAVDLVLRGGGRTAVAEVTSNASSRGEEAFDRSERLVQQIDALYDGSSHWALHFGEGYAPPKDELKAATFAKAMVRDLSGAGGTVRRESHPASHRVMAEGAEDR